MDYMPGITKLYLIMSIVIGLLISSTSKTLSTTKYSREDINAIARMTTVLVSSWEKGDEEKCTNTIFTYPDFRKRKRQIVNNSGSGGLVVAKKNNVYYILTNGHTIKPNDCYGIVMWNGIDQHKKYILEESDIEYIDGEFDSDSIDLALIKLEIKSNDPKEKYYIASLHKDSDSIPKSSQLFISGWPEVEGRSASTERRFVSATREEWKTDSNLCTPTNKGYKWCYLAKTSTGMSGGPILNTYGYVVGTHAGERGRNEKNNQSQKLPIKTGIPINEFLNLIDAGRFESLTRDDLNFDPPNPELIAKGKINTKQADTIEDLFELFLGCIPVLQNEAECRKNPGPFEWNNQCE